MAQRWDARFQPQADNTQGRQSGAALLSAGMIFILGMATNATTVWNVQRNIQELTGVSLSIQKLAGQSSDLALAREHHPPGDEERVRAEPEAIDNSGSDTWEEPLPALPRSGSAASVREPGKRRADGRWGPPLLLNSSRATSAASKPDAYPRVGDLQSNLLVLGFDVGEDHANGITGSHTLQALDEFRMLYVPERGRQKAPDSDELTTTVRKYAGLAREDNRKFGIDSGILAAIRLSSIRTGVDFSFLMELAAAESSFDPTKIARKTAATGLYQFKDDTWLDAVRTYGKKYGIGGYALQVENYIDDTGKVRPTIRDPLIHQHVLDLRRNPRISVLLAAEYVKNNMKQLADSLDHEPGYTELYLTHFFGMKGAISFLKALDENPDRIAGEVFPKAAENNQSIFRPTRSKPRTVVEIYKMFDRKFNTSRYKDANPS